MVRGPFLDENGVKRGAWSEEEDERLKSYVQTYGHPNWRQLPKLAGLARCGKSCRLRWMNYLRPNLKHGNYTPQEEETIIKLHEQHGNKWSLIAENLPGRTDNDVKNHWHSQLKRRPKGKDRSINSELKAKKRNHSNDNSEEYSECDIMKVVAESHSILESSSLECTEQMADGDNSASVVSIEDTTESTVNFSGSAEEESSEASWQTNSFLEFSGDFWTEPFISEKTYDEYYNSDYQIGGSGGIFTYYGPELY